MPSTALLKIPEIKGQSLTDGFPDHIDLLSWGFDVHQNNTDITQSTGGTQGAGSSGFFSFNKKFDIATANLQKFCIAGTHIPTIEIIQVRAAGGQEKVLKYTLTKCVIVNWSISGQDQDLPYETFAIAAGHWKMETWKQKDDGTVETGPEAQWNNKTGKEEAPS